MGRGGFSGGSSGRSSSGGSSGRSSSGGWAGSSRGGYSSSSRSYSSGPSRSYSSGPSRSYYDTHGNYYGRSSGCGTLLSIIVVILIIIHILYPGMIYNVLYYISNGRQSSIITNTVNREPLQSSALKDTTSIIQDDAHWLDSQNTVKTAMDYFRTKTGVQPMLIISESLNGKKSFNKDDVDKYLETVYDSRFKDEGHIIVYFCEVETEKYFRLIYAGTAAATVIDNSAQNIMLQYIDKYYYSDYTDDQYFYRIFKDSADKIMEKVTTKEDVAKNRNFYIFIIIGIGLAGFITVKIINAKRKEKEAAAKVLNSDIGGSI